MSLDARWTDTNKRHFASRPSTRFNNNNNFCAFRSAVKWARDQEIRLSTCSGRRKAGNTLSFSLGFYLDVFGGLKRVRFSSPSTRATINRRDHGNWFNQDRERLCQRCHRKWACCGMACTLPPVRLDEDQNEDEHMGYDSPTVAP